MDHETLSFEQLSKVLDVEMKKTWLMLGGVLSLVGGLCIANILSHLY